MHSLLVDGLKVEVEATVTLARLLSWWEDEIGAG
jgi:hypothetical protein